MHLRSLILLLSIICHSASILASDCLFKGCSCSSSSLDNSYDVKCVYDIMSNNSRFPVRQSSSSFQNREINIMLVNRYSFKRIPDNIFRNLSIRTLILAENDLEVLNKRAFSGIRGLRMLHLIEKRLKRIEPGVFEPLGNGLTEINLINLIGMTTGRVDEFFRETVYLEHLDTFKLNHMRFDTLKEEWMAFLGNLRYLSLASNNLRNLSVDLFELSTRLISLDLNDNYLSEIDPLFRTLDSVKSNLKELKLSSNGIRYLKDFPSFERLEFLDLSRNKLTWIGDSTFKQLRNLNYLHLNSNNIRNLHPEVFSPLENLLVLNLANNHISTLPHIRSLYKLQSFDVSSQNGSLISIADYGFDRGNLTTSSLSIDLSGNELTHFGFKSFCSHRPSSNITQIHDVTLTYETVRNMKR